MSYFVYIQIIVHAELLNKPSPHYVKEYEEHKKMKTKYVVEQMVYIHWD